jgi:tryptophan 2,3-dioxygenase
MREQLAVLATLPLTAYQEIREGLGQGSGQDSPRYRAVLN